MKLDLSGPPPRARTLEEAQKIIDFLWQALRELKTEFENKIEAQALEIRELKARLAKNSQNSSKPPSSDALNKPNPKSQRARSERKTGGQKGHVGVTLEQVANPDFIEDHKVQACENCRCSLEGVEVMNAERRQEFEIPPIKVQITEHRAEVKVCPNCGFENKAKFPEHITQPVQYGSRVKAMATYFSQGQLLPYKRLQEIFRDIYALPLSEGTLFNINHGCYEQLTWYEEEAKRQIIASEVANLDESGIRVKKELQWLHVAATPELTYYEIHQKRGAEAMNEIGILPKFKGHAIHDHWKPYFSYNCKHGLCNAHHLRELTYHAEQYAQTWCEKMRELLLTIKEAVEKSKEDGRQKLSEEQINYFCNKFNQVLKKGAEEIPILPQTSKKRGREKQHPTKNLWNRLREYQKETLAFMYDFSVPFTNNQGERDIRMAKLKQKISGCFRSQRGAKIFCRIRGYISTVRKNGFNILDALTKTFEGNPILPSENCRFDTS